MDKTVVRKEPILRDRTFWIEVDKDGTAVVTVSCPQEGGIGGAKTVTGSPALIGGLTAALTSAKKEWGGYGA